MAQTTLEEMRESYDWTEAFAYAAAPMVEVASVLSSDDGENDGDPWVAVFRLLNGKFMFLTAGCDYTGWDCQAGGDSIIRDDMHTLIYNDIGEYDRKRLGYQELKVPDSLS